MAYIGQIAPTPRQAALQLINGQTQQMGLQQQLLLRLHKTAMQGECIAFAYAYLKPGQ